MRANLSRALDPGPFQTPDRNDPGSTSASLRVAPGPGKASTRPAHPTSAAYDKNPTLSPGAICVVASSSSTRPSVSRERGDDAGAFLGCLTASITPSGARRSATRTYSRRPFFFLCAKVARTGSAISGVGLGAGEPRHEGTHHPREGHERRHRIARQPHEGGAGAGVEPGITPMATGRPGLTATRQNTSRPIASTALRTWSASPVDTPPEVSTRSCACAAAAIALL